MLWTGLVHVLLVGAWKVVGFGVFGVLLELVGRAFIRSRSEQERFLVYWLLALIAVVLGVIALFSGVLMGVLEDWDSSRGIHPLAVCGAIAIIVGAIDTFLFQIYYRVVEDDGRTVRANE
jgi:hypothetical protein